MGEIRFIESGDYIFRIFILVGLLQIYLIHNTL